MNRGPEPPTSDIEWLMNTHNVVKNEEIVEHDHQMFIVTSRRVSTASQLAPFAGNIPTDLVEWHDATRALVPDQ
jgi:hypothetical protein